MQKECIENAFVIPFAVITMPAASDSIRIRHRVPRWWWWWWWYTVI